MIAPLRRIAGLGQAHPRLRPTAILLVFGFGLAGAKLVLTVGGFAALEASPPDAPVAFDWPAPPEPAAGPEPTVPGTPPPEPAIPPDPDPLTAAASPIEQELLVDLSRRRALLEARAEDLDLKEKLIRTAAAELSRQVEQLERLKTAIDAQIDDHDAGEEAEIARLVKIYETMKPKAAAAVFDRLEMPVLLELVTRMKEARAADVMARMRPDRAEAVTRELAHRRRLGELLASRLGESRDPR